MRFSPRQLGCRKISAMRRAEKKMGWLTLEDFTGSDTFPTKLPAYSKIKGCSCCDFMLCFGVAAFNGKQPKSKDPDPKRKLDIYLSLCLLVSADLRTEVRKKLPTQIVFLLFRWCHAQKVRLVMPYSHISFFWSEICWSRPAFSSLKASLVTYLMQLALSSSRIAWRCSSKIFVMDP